MILRGPDSYTSRRLNSLMHWRAVLLEGVKVSCTGMLFCWKVSKSHAPACDPAGRCQSLMHRHAVLLEGVKVLCTGMLFCWKVSEVTGSVKMAGNSFRTTRRHSNMHRSLLPLTPRKPNWCTRVWRQSAKPVM